MARTAFDSTGPERSPATVRIALLGNPNSGKTSLFNGLTGAHQRVGNYPGITVERRDGSYRAGEFTCEVTDLPGTYSLTSFSPEERVARQELLERDHEVVVLVADSTNLNRGLVLLVQVLQLGVNPVLCLNMADEARAAGQRLDVAMMQNLLGFPVVETVGHRAEGIKDLRVAIDSALAKPIDRHRLVLGERLDNAIAAIRSEMDEATVQAGTADWLATQLLIDDPTLAEPARAERRGLSKALSVAQTWRRKIEQETRFDIDLFVTERYFGYVDGLLREVTLRRPRSDARVVSDRVDALLVHRVLGLPIFAALMYLIFWVTFSVGEIPMGWIEDGFAALGVVISGMWPAGADSPLRSLLVDGLIGGVGGVIVFVPNIVLLFAGLALLEDTGYLARVAFLMDQLMHRFGLHGKSFIPMLTGFGCSIPGIMATRTLENERDRLTTMLVLPLMSCGARLPIWMLLIPAFFPPVLRAPMLWGIYASGIVLAFALAYLLRRSVLKGEEAPFVMELPPYRLPTLRAVIMKMSERAWLYLRKAGTVILGISILMWALSAYPKPERFAIDVAMQQGEVQVLDLVDPKGLTEQDLEARRRSALARARAAAPQGVRVMTREAVNNARSAEALDTSIAGRIGGLIEPVLRPLGFDRRLSTAMLGAFAAKEVFVAQLGIVYALGETDEQSRDLRGALARDYSPLVGISLMLFLLIATPCMATVAVTRRESGSWRWAMLQLFGLTGVAWVISFVVYQVGSLFGA